MDQRHADPRVRYAWRCALCEWPEKPLLSPAAEVPPALLRHAEDAHGREVARPFSQPAINQFGTYVVVDARTLEIIRGRPAVWAVDMPEGPAARPEQGTEPWAKALDRTAEALAAVAELSPDPDLRDAILHLALIARRHDPMGATHARAVLDAVASRAR